MALTGKDGKLLLRNGGIAIGQECCCGGAPCCGIPANCTLSVYIGLTFTWNHGTQSWDITGSGPGEAGFGDCRNFTENVPEEPPADNLFFPNLGNEYATCCAYGLLGGEYLPCLAQYSGIIIGRIVCDQCCEDPSDDGVNCRIEGVQKVLLNDTPGCSATVEELLDYANWSITLTCDEADCNGFP